MSQVKISTSEPARRRTAAARFQRSVASPMSASLAYTALCLLTLIFAVCVEKMPEQFIARVEQIRGLFS